MSNPVPFDTRVYRAMYYADPIAARIVDALPGAAMRRGYKADDSLREDADRLGLDAAVLKLMQWGRRDGGALLFPGLPAGDLKKPLTPGEVGRTGVVRFFRVVPRRRVTILTWDEDPLSPRYGQPAVYQILSRRGAVVHVHATRVWRWDGVEDDDSDEAGLAGWSWSVLHRPYEALRDFATATGSLSTLLADASQAVWKMQGVAKAAAVAKLNELVAVRMGWADQARGAGKAVVIDKDGEDFARVATPLSGIPESVDRLMALVSAACGIPQTILFGRSPAGMNATGESDLTIWYDQVREEQPKIAALLRWCYRLLGAAEDLEVTFPPLWEPTETEAAGVEKTKADVDVALTQAEILLPEEALLLRRAPAEDIPEILEAILERAKASLAGGGAREAVAAAAPPPADVPPEAPPLSDAPKPPVNEEPEEDA